MYSTCIMVQCSYQSPQFFNRLNNYMGKNVKPLSTLWKPHCQSSVLAILKTVKVFIRSVGLQTNPIAASFPRVQFHRTEAKCPVKCFLTTA